MRYQIGMRVYGAYPLTLIMQLKTQRTVSRFHELVARGSVQVERPRGGHARFPHVSSNGASGGAIRFCTAQCARPRIVHRDQAIAIYVARVAWRHGLAPGCKDEFNIVDVHLAILIDIAR